MERLEARLVELAASHGAVLGEHAGTTIAAGGKRLRPLLVFLAAGPEPRDPGGVLRAAVAVELVHSATLVHDDVLDAAPLRRGRPTVVSVAGRAMATATGDLLFSRAFAELAGGGSAEAVRILSDASSALAQGELLQREDAWDATISRERYDRRCDLKTARLFEAACRLGALGGCGDPELLGRFGRSIRRGRRWTCWGSARPQRRSGCATRSPPREHSRPRGPRRWRWSRPRRRRS